MKSSNSLENECSAYASSASLFLLGVAVGTGAALLMAPMSGREMRSTIRRRTDEGTRALRHRVDETREKANAFVEESRQKAASLVNEAHAVVDSHVQHLTDEKDRIAAAVRAGRDAYRSTARESLG